MPTHIANVPQLLPGLQIYLEAWFTLVNFRKDRLLELSTILDYCKIYDIINEQRDLFIEYLSAINTAFSEWQRKEDEKAAKAAKATKKRR